MLLLSNQSVGSLGPAGVSSTETCGADNYHRFHRNSGFDSFLCKKKKKLGLPKIFNSFKAVACYFPFIVRQTLHLLCVSACARPFISLLRICILLFVYIYLIVTLCVCVCWGKTGYFQGLFCKK